MFEIIVKKTIKISHGLINYKGKTEPTHKHNWLIEIKFSSNKLDKAGCAIDFIKIDKHLDKTLIPLKNKSLNKLKYFKNKSPSAENFAKYIYDKLKIKFKNLGSVTAWEDKDHGAIYYKNTKF